MKNAIISIALLTSVLSFTSCKQNGAADEKGVSTDVVGATAAFSFTEESHDFGRIQQGEKVFYSFKFTNSGTTDLVISSAHGSCGCTVPQYPKEPIKPGAEGVIDVTFDSDNKSGVVNKTVTLVANTTPNTKVLSITADVLVKPQTEEEKTKN